MELWSAISKIALLGTNRTQLSKNLKEQLAKYPIDNFSDDTNTILTAAAILTPLRKAGFPLKKAIQEKELPIQKKENYCSEHSIRHLQAILRLAYDQSLVEFLKHAQQQQKILPPEILPFLFDECIKNKTLWNIIRPIIGSRGNWLIRQNEAWESLIIEAKPEDWVIYSKTQQLGMLHFLRATDPSLGLTILKDNWESIPIKNRPAYLKQLEQHLSLADEEFLEKCLDNKRKEARMVAQELLRSLEDSAFEKRMETRFQNWVQFKKSEKSKFVFLKKDALYDSDKRDGFLPLMKWRKQQGQIGQLYYLMSCLSPKQLEKILDLSPHEIIQVMTRSDNAVVFIQAAIDSTARFGNEKWASKLFEFWQANQFKARWKDLDVKKLIHQCSNNVFNKIAIQCFHNNPNLLDESNLTLQLLKNEKQAWSVDLGLLFIKKWAEWIQSHKAGYWEAAQYKFLLKNMAYRAHPDTYLKIRNILPPSAVQWTGWEEDYTRLLKILRFRNDMIRELKRK